MKFEHEYFHIIFPPPGPTAYAENLTDAIRIASSIGEPCPIPYIWQVGTNFKRGDHQSNFIRQVITKSPNKT